MNKGGKGLGGIMDKDGKRGSIKGWERGQELRFGKWGKVNSGIMGKGGKGEKVSDGKRVKIKGGKREGLRVVERGKG